MFWLYIYKQAIFIVTLHSKCHKRRSAICTFYDVN